MYSSVSGTGTQTDSLAYPVGGIFNSKFSLLHSFHASRINQHTLKSVYIVIEYHAVVLCSNLADPGNGFIENRVFYS